MTWSTERIILASLSGLALLVALGMWGIPRWHVYSQQLEGQAKLAEAESSRRIAILEAEAKKESAEKLADAEIARARGVAEANKIIGQSLHGNEAYLRYLWIQNLHEGKAQVVYVPTEANLPILEAQRLAPPPAKVEP